MKRLSQKGFTLIELSIVGIFFGILAIFSISQFSGSVTESTRANALIDASSKIASNWSVLVQQCGTSYDIEVNNLTDISGQPSSRNLSLLLGNLNPSSAITSCYRHSGIKPLSGVATGSSSSEKVHNFPVHVSYSIIAGSPRLIVSFDNVPDNIALPLYNKLNATSGGVSSAMPATSDSSDIALRFSAKVNGSRTVSIVQPL